MNTSNNPSETVRDTIAAHKMLAGGENVLVAVSGGPDSMALLHILKGLAPDFGLALHVFHLDHMMRGGAGRADAVFVEQTAGALGLPVTVLTADVPAYVQAHRVSPEDGARRVRRELMFQLADEIGAEKIALGHNADDCAETFLMRLIRGAGLDGLRSIRAVNGPIIRPLIRLARADIESYCLAYNLQPRRDETNSNIDIARNKIRHRLLPLLEAEYNPNIRAELGREIASVNDDAVLLGRLAEEAFDAVAMPAEKAVNLDRTAFLSLPAALQRRVLRLAALELAGEPQPLGFTHVADILSRVVGGNSGAGLDLPGGLSAAREYDTIVMKVSVSEPESERPVGPETVLSVPGLTMLPGTDLAIEARFAPVSEFTAQAGPDVAFLDAALIVEPVTARSRLPGDRVQPLGMRGRKLLSDLFIDDKTSRDMRVREPVILTGGRIAWVAGHAIDDRFKVAPGTKEILILRLLRGSC